MLTTCSNCLATITDPADEWPNSGGMVCTDCWEIDCADLWWQTVVRLEAPC